MNGSLALVGSGEYLPQMMEFEKSLINDGLANGKNLSTYRSQLQLDKKVIIELITGNLSVPPLPLP